jgi:FKBP-type peptidyl-prolyl cis-trans isomerase FkpA
MKRAILLMALLATAGCGSSATSADDLPPTSVGVYTQTDVIVGIGATAAVGSSVTISYAGWLYDTGKPFGKGAQFDPGAAPLSFVIVDGQFLAAFEQAVVGMKVGGLRRIILPPELAYGDNPPANSIIPKKATLVFEITLTAVR